MPRTCKEKSHSVSTETATAYADVALSQGDAGRREKHCYSCDYDAPSITCGLKNECVRPGWCPKSCAALERCRTLRLSLFSKVLACINSLAVGLLHHTQ